MLQRGVTKEEVELTMKDGWKADDAKTGTEGKVFVFSYNNEWEGKYFAEKEVTVYYRVTKGKILPLTVKSRYGEHFIKRR
jgi:phenolic acid decarboxylase